MNLMKILNYLSEKNRQGQIFFILQLVFILDRLNARFFNQTSIYIIIFSFSILLFVFTIYLTIMKLKKRIFNYNVFFIIWCLLCSVLWFLFNLLTLLND